MTREQYNKSYKEIVSKISALFNEIGILRYRELIRCKNDFDYKIFKNRVNVKYRNKFDNVSLAEAQIKAIETLELFKDTQTIFKALQQEHYINEEYGLYDD